MAWAAILGASSGTGAAIAMEVARAPGLDVFGVHRGHFLDGAAAVERAVAAAGRRVVMRVDEAGTADGAATGAESLYAAAGPRSVKLLVHAIANGSVGRLLPEEGRSEETTREPLSARKLDKTMNAMAHSFVHWARELVEHDLLADGALLLGLTNPLGDTLLGNTAAITAAKAALEIYVRHLAVELGPRGHRVNLLRFGTVVTPAVQRVYSPAAMERLEERHKLMNPAGRMCTTEEVARFVSLLLDERAAFMTGATIDFSGGMNLKLIDLLLNPA